MLVGSCFGQKDSLGHYCNVFYLTSDNHDVLPFDNDCFIVDRYTLHNPHHFRTVGPIVDHIDLFKHFPWVISFHLPEINSEGDRVSLQIPDDYLAKGVEMPEGKFFLTITDNRDGSRYEPVSENIDFVAISGNGRVTGFRPMDEGDTHYHEYDLQIDVRVRKLDRSGTEPKLTGEPIRVRFVVVVEKLD